MVKAHDRAGTPRRLCPKLSSPFRVYPTRNPSSRTISLCPVTRNHTPLAPSIRLASHINPHTHPSFHPTTSPSRNDTTYRAYITSPPRTGARRLPFAPALGLARLSHCLGDPCEPLVAARRTSSPTLVPSGPSCDRSHYLGAQESRAASLPRLTATYSGGGVTHRLRLRQQRRCSDKSSASDTIF
jgi:hypothetical protein